LEDPPPQIHLGKVDLMTRTARDIAAVLLHGIELPDRHLAGVKPGLTAVCDALARERDLSSVGRERAIQLLADNLRRLRAILDDRNRYPEITRVQPVRPVFILGLPRCGTSLLHALMGSDPSVRTPLQWEVAAPSPPPEAATFDSDPRAAAFDAYVDKEFVGKWADVRKAHPIGARIPQECGMILETAFCGINPSMLFKVEPFFEWYVQADTTYGYEVHRMWLQHLGWRNPRRYWVLKVQEHMYHLPELLKVYPDALFIQPHRDPVTVMASISALIRTIRSVSFEAQDATALGEEMLRLWHEGQVRMMAYRKAHPSLRVYDMRYKDLAANPVEAVRAAYRFHGMEFTDAAAAAIRRWLVENPADKHGRHTYRLEDFNLTESRIRDVYADYIDTYRDYI
jgi:Sulfotransferase family